MRVDKWVDGQGVDEVDAMGEWMDGGFVDRYVIIFFFIKVKLIIMSPNNIYISGRTF